MERIVRAARGADVVLLATDPDREGEAISWLGLTLVPISAQLELFCPPCNPT
jgi:DNA topoisomerase IA